MKYSWFRQLDARGIVTALAEIRILVNGTGDKTGDFSDLFGVGAKYERE